MTALDTVNTFIKAAANRDYETALPLLAENVEYHNIPMPPVHGAAAVKDTIEMLLGMCSESEWVVHRELSDGELVMNERTDRFLVDGRWLELPVAGVFVVRDGLIELWRDYFDLDMIMKQLASPTE